MHDGDVTETHLERAEEAFIADDRVAALEELLLAWRASRAAAIAEVIEIVSRDLTRGRQSPVEDDAWYAYRAVDLGLLLAVLEGSDWQHATRNIALLEKWPDDPRIASRLANDASVFRWKQIASERLYRRLFSLLARQRDPRCAVVLDDRQRRGYGDYSFHKSLEGLLTTLLDELPSALPLDEKMRAKVRLLEKHARRLSSASSAHLDEASITKAHDAWHARAASVPSATTEAALFAQVVAAPDDDAPRIVLGDFWLEQNDPRGEIMALALQPKRKTADEKKLRKLLSAHAHRLVGPLVVAIDLKAASFERGLLSKCEVRFENDAQRESLIGHSLWSTVRDLESEEPRLITHSCMRAMRTLRTSAYCLAEIDKHDKPLPVETLWLVRGGDFPEGAIPISIRANKCMRNVRVVGLRLVPWGGMPITPNVAPWLFERHFADRIEELIIDCAFGWSPEPRLDLFVAKLRDSSRLKQLRCLIPRSTTEISIAKTGAHLAMTLSFGEKPCASHSIDFVVGKLNPDHFDEVIALSSPKHKTGLPYRRAIEPTLARFNAKWR